MGICVQSKNFSLSIKSSAAVDSVLPTFVAASESVPAVVDGELPHSLI